MNTLFSNPKLKSKKNTLEALDIDSDLTGKLNKLLKSNHEHADQSEKKPLPIRNEFTIFSHTRDQESRLIPQEISKLTAEIRHEIQQLKKTQKSLSREIVQIEKQTIQSMPDKPGIYHVRFLEIILSFLRALISKTNESRTWLAAMQTKRKKRGSLFAQRKKKLGTQYSLSQELHASRNTM